MTDVDRLVGRLALALAALAVVGAAVAVRSVGPIARTEAPTVVAAAPFSPTATATVRLQARAPERGGWSEKTIVVRRGTRVRLVLRAVDTPHGFELAAFGVKVLPLLPGKEQRVEFVADKEGHFPFACNLVCSPRHAEMVGQLVVRR
ncbi:MAG: hypothetical protein QN135_05390 [Armatimonadota bacterium]|nr:hypothetical protein [Armatimonadota bacterium]